MKIAQAFKDITKPEDIEPKALELYLRQLYLDPSYEVKDASYVEGSEEELETGYKRRANLLLDQLIKITGNLKFEDLRSHLNDKILPGDSRIIVDQMKKTMEIICFNHEHNLIATPIKFNNEISSSTINECTPGALTNMQKILYSMNDSLYMQKYEYIQNLAIQYVRDKRLADHPGNEVHMTNQLIHEASIEYNITPPLDIYARYRDLSKAPSKDFIEFARFTEYLNKQLESREGIYNFVNIIANNHLSNLPDAPKNGIFYTKKDEQESIELEKITMLAQALNIPITDIIKYSADGSEFEYNPNYADIIVAATMQDIIRQDIIEHEPLNLITSAITEIPARKELAKNAEGKILRDKDNKPIFNIIPARTITQTTNTNIIEAPTGWYIAEEIAEKISLKQKILDNKYLNGLTIKNQNIEDYIHINFASSGLESKLKSIIEINNEISESAQTALSKELFLLSDQAQEKKNIYPLKNFCLYQSQSAIIGLSFLTYLHKKKIEKY